MRLAATTTAAAASTAAAVAVPSAPTEPQALPIEAHFDRVRANLIRCEECNENFFFDFLRHPRYFVAHFKACHLKNVLYRFNGVSEEENQRIRFGPRRKKDATTWFSQLKSTEKRMISMQDNKWSEIAEKECWVCRVCNDRRADLTHAYEPNDFGQRQALLHLRQMHVTAYDAFLRVLPEVSAASIESEAIASETSGSNMPTTANDSLPTTAESTTMGIGISPLVPLFNPNGQAAERRSAEAERSRLRRLRATPEERELEAIRSRKRREKMTPAQRHADYERRRRKKKRLEEAERSKKRRKEATQELKEKEVLRSRDRRRKATQEQREREAQRSRERRKKATQEQKIKERERCRQRYEAKKSSQQPTTSPSESETQSSGRRRRRSGRGKDSELLQPPESFSSRAAGANELSTSNPVSSRSTLESSGGVNRSTSITTAQSLYASLAEPPVVVQAVPSGAGGQPPSQSKRKPLNRPVSL